MGTTSTKPPAKKRLVLWGVLYRRLSATCPRMPNQRPPTCQSAGTNSASQLRSSRRSLRNGTSLHWKWLDAVHSLTAGKSACRSQSNVSSPSTTPRCTDSEVDGEWQWQRPCIYLLLRAMACLKELCRARARARCNKGRGVDVRARW